MKYWNGTHWIEKTSSLDGDNIITDATTARQLSLVDINKHLRFTTAGAITITIPLDATDDLPKGFGCENEQAGVGIITYVPEGPVVIHSKDAKLSSNGQYGSSYVKKIGPNEWRIVGDLA